MNAALTVCAGVSCVIAGCLLPRSGAGARWRPFAGAAVDFAFPLLFFAWLVVATARPLFSGAMSFALCAAYAYADRAKRSVLGEPIVHTDVFQAIDVFRHPRIAEPFPDKLPILSGIAGTTILFGALFGFEPKAWSWTPTAAIASTAAIVLMGWMLRTGIGLAIGRGLRRLRPSGDAFSDAATFGPFGMLFVHGLVAHAERAARRVAVPSQSPTSLSAIDGPLVLVQCESFFDARRLGPLVPPELLPGYEACTRTGLQWGRLEVPCWGANTVRTEFAVLSGLPQTVLGFDRFNPYHRFARQPLPTIATRMRAAGYRTICLHPFDRRFYARDRVMYELGFDEFIGEEAFVGATRINGYVADREVARVACELLKQHGARLFLFIVTMEGHGPWQRTVPSATRLGAGFGLRATERSALENYLDGLTHTDAMLALLREYLDTHEPQATLAAYGDHLPSLASTFARLGLRDRRSDYFIWQANGRGSAEHRDLRANEIGEAVITAHARQEHRATRTVAVRNAAPRTNR